MGANLGLTSGNTANFNTGQGPSFSPLVPPKSVLLASQVQPPVRQAEEWYCAPLGISNYELPDSALPSYSLDICAGGGGGGKLQSHDFYYLCKLGMKNKRFISSISALDRITFTNFCLLISFIRVGLLLLSSFFLRGLL